MLGNKLGNFVDGVDNLLTLSYMILITDDLISNVNDTYSLPIAVSINNALNSTTNQNFTIARNGTEIPGVDIVAYFTSDTSISYASKYIYI